MGRKEGGRDIWNYQLIIDQMAPNFLSASGTRLSSHILYKHHNSTPQHPIKLLLCPTSTPQPRPYPILFCAQIYTQIRLPESVQAKPKSWTLAAHPQFWRSSWWTPNWWPAGMIGCLLASSFWGICCYGGLRWVLCGGYCWELFVRLFCSIFLSYGFDFLFVWWRGSLLT